MRIGGVARLVAVTRPLPGSVGQEDARQPLLQLLRHLLQGEQPARSDRAFDLELVAVEVVVALQRLEQEVVDREPHRPAPVGVPAEETAVPFRRDVVHAMGHALHVDLVRVVVVHSRDRADAVRREKLGFIQQIPQHPLQPLAGREWRAAGAGRGRRPSAAPCTRCGAPGPADWSRNQFIRFRKPWRCSNFASSSTSAAISGMTPTSERIRSARCSPSTWSWS